MTDLTITTLGFALMSDLADQNSENPWEPIPLPSFQTMYGNELPIFQNGDKRLGGLVTVDFELFATPTKQGKAKDNFHTAVMKKMEKYLFNNPQVYGNSIPILATDKVFCNVMTFQQTFKHTAPRLVDHGFCIKVEKVTNKDKYLFTWKIQKEENPNQPSTEEMWNSAAGTAFERNGRVTNSKIFIINTLTIKPKILTPRTKSYQVFTIGEIDGFLKDEFGKLQPMEMKAAFNKMSIQKVEKYIAKCRICQCHNLVLGIHKETQHLNKSGDRRRFKFSGNVFSLKSEEEKIKLVNLFNSNGQISRTFEDIETQQQTRLHLLFQMFYKCVGDFNIFYINGCAIYSNEDKITYSNTAKCYRM